MSVDLTIAICTWNRASIIGGTLDAVCSLEIPADTSWEVLIVDNNSSDNTVEVVSRYETKLPLRYVLEPNAGTSFARNRAVNESKGKLFISLDDDCRPQSDLVMEYLQAMGDHPDVAVFGGTMEPEFECAPPRWISDNLDSLNAVLARLKRPGANRYLAPNEPVVTGNMAIRTEILKRYPFDTKLGYVGSNRMAGEDIDLYARLRADGHRAFWVGTANVRHFIPKRSISLDAITRKYVGEGRLQVRFEQDPRVFRRATFGVPRWAIKQFLKAQLTSWLCYPFRSRRWLEAFICAATMRGFIAESRYRARAALNSRHVA